MNILITIFVILFVLSLTDFIGLSNERLHKQIYSIAFFLAYFFFVIKYYYGADIAQYVAVYDTIESPWVLLTKGTKIDDYFEPGYLFFCSILKYIGFSYWMMTALITTIYFYVIHKLFERIPSKKIFALLILVLFDYNLIFAAFRQCLAVSFFILMILAYIDKKYMRTIIFFILASLMHKSALYLSMLFLTAMIISNARTRIKIENKNYLILAGILIILCLFSFQSIILTLASKLSLSGSAYASLAHHLLLSKKIQVIVVIYLFSIVAIMLYSNFDNKNREQRIIRMLVFLSFVIIVVLYQQHFLLNRLRSYFLPFLIVFVFTILEQDVHKISKKSFKLFQQIFVIVTFLYCARLIFTLNHAQKELKSGIYESSTVFSLLTKSEEQIKKEQLKKANYFWGHEYEDIVENK